MTPTLLGRWQTRFFLTLTIGLLFSLPFVYFYGLTPLVVLGLVLGFGVLWDLYYIYLQSRRWERDWPPVYQLYAGIWEGIFVFLVTLLLRRFVAIFDVPLSVFLLQYGIVWITTFIASQSLMRILFPNWRYRGGQLFY